MYPQKGAVNEDEPKYDVVLVVMVVHIELFGSFPVKNSDRYNITYNMLHLQLKNVSQPVCGQNDTTDRNAPLNNKVNI